VTPIAQGLLFVSYAILGLAVMIIPPRFFGWDQQLFGFMGMLVFFGAWMLQNWLVVNKSESDAKTRLDQLEDTVLILRKDLQRARRELESRGREGDEKNETLVSELKMLQTLLTQVTRKEIELNKGKKSKAPVPKATEEDALELSVDHTPSEDPAAVEAEGEGADEEEVRQDSMPDEAPAQNADEDTVEDDEVTDTEAAIEELELTPEEAAMVVVDDGEELTPASAPETTAKTPAPRPGQGGQAAAKVRKKAPIRLIKREDQLLKVVRSSLSENRVDLYLQPIVGLPSRRTVHYECFSRVRDEEGRIILPRQYLKVAENKGLIGTIDNLLLFRLIQLVRRLGKRHPEMRFFCNMSRHSMMDEEFFPQFIDFMSDNQEFSGRLVFEIAQEDYNQLDGDVIDRLQKLGRRGFGFSMDMVTSFEQDWPELEKYYFQFIKSDFTDLMLAHPEVGDVEAFKSSIRRRGMQLIGSRIEDEPTVLKALDAGVEYAQGYLFGEPMSSNDMNREL
jgi:EAL domain-containing protein (putative c-di-GMP-specific phosphodiesterase class I)